jgi:phospholipid/cholesterol/gamma-HCH transport system ATP-binding protein
MTAVSAETGTNPDLIELRDLEFSFGDRPVHRGISLKVPRGQVVVIIGPSGCGKSTILNLIGGRLFADRGSVLVDGENVAKLSRRRLFDLRKRMGMMFQNSALLTDLTVFENVAFPVRENTSLPDSIIRDLVLLKLQMVGLRGARSLYPDECSGGMQRRVALARAIALDPMLVMYDEPFTGLDPIAKGVIVKLIREVNDAIGMTSVVVTHDVAEGCEIADYIYLLGDGQVIAEGTPAEMQASTEPDVRQFMSGLPDGPVAYHYPAPGFHEDLLEGAE